jgi:hypothetical protein
VFAKYVGFVIASKSTAHGALLSSTTFCHCEEPHFGEAIPKFGWEIASTGKERRFRTCTCGTGAGNDTKQEVATLQTP